MRKQLVINLDKGTRGGRRNGSGRKRLHSPGVSHKGREKVSGRTPLHINFKYRCFIKNKQCLKLLKRAIINSRRQGLRILHYSMQTNHLHFIVEADSNKILTKGMRSLTITFAKGLHKGRVQLERYHLHVLRTLKETTNAIRYVLFNQQKHEKGTYSKIDEYSSLMSHKDVLKVIRNFALKKKMTVIVGRRKSDSLDDGKSMLFRLGISHLGRLPRLKA